MPNQIRFLLLASVLVTTACTTSGTSGNSPFHLKDAGLPAGSEITLTEPLQIAADTARAYFPASAINGDDLSCYFEVNTVGGADTEATIEPGTFSVLWSRNSSDPIGVVNRPTRWGFNDNSPSYVEMVHTVRLRDDRSTDVRAIKCRETFTDLDRARYPTLADLQTVAGSALTF